MSDRLKVLAVIPARAGSKGIPNKNLRLLEGKPLVAYAIENAISSTEIDEVVVTTDSPEVAAIAECLGARVHWRSAELCADDVTLDAVVVDAARGGQWRCVVTMQPTSPTLKSATIDAAIRRFFERGSDTVISVVNSPHLSWREDGEGFAPNYIERLNRQYLPPHYIETGAFLVSDGELVQGGARIGEHVDVFEVSESEAVDIDTFADLSLAAFLLRSKRVAIIVNGNNERGMGHVYRALELADEFYDKPDIIFDITQTEVSIFGDTTHNLLGVDGEEGLAEALGRNDYDLIINDILATSIEYMDFIRSCQPRAAIVNFEDEGEGAKRADLVFNALFDSGHAPNVLHGSGFYIAPKLFLFYDPIKIASEVRRVFVSFGGSDPQDYSGRILKLISRGVFGDAEFVVVLGRAKADAPELLERYSDCPHLKLFYDVRNMPALMASCDIAITSRGRTGYELALLGIPSVAMSQNENEEGHNFISEDNGFVYIGTNPSDYQIGSTIKMMIGMPPEDRREMQRKMLAHDLRSGRDRVMNRINAL